MYVVPDDDVNGPLTASVQVTVCHDVAPVVIPWAPDLYLLPYLGAAATNPVTPTLPDTNAVPKTSKLFLTNTTFEELIVIAEAPDPD